MKQDPRDDQAMRWEDIRKAALSAPERTAHGIASRRLLFRLRQALREDGPTARIRPAPALPWRLAPVLVTAALVTLVVLLPMRGPRAPASPEALSLRVVDEPGGVVLSWDDAGGRTYRVSRCYIRADLQACEDVTLTTGNRFRDPAPSQLAKQFDLVMYRVTPISDSAAKS